MRQSSHCKWSKASEDETCQYRCVLDRTFEHSIAPIDMLECDNVNCNDPAHTDAIDTICSGMINACLQARKDVIPQADDKQRSVCHIGMYIIILALDMV